MNASLASTDETPAPPLPTGTIPEVIYAQDGGAQSVSTQAGFTGEDLVYTLEAAPGGVTIQAGSGLVSIPTVAPIARTTIRVRASNGGGSATQSFAVTVRSTVTVFDAAAKLGDLGFVFDTAAPGWAQENNYGRLIPAATGRAHGLWSKAAGDGRYRCLARWAATETTGPDYAPFVLGARIARSGGNFTGVYVEAFRPASGTKRLRLQQYTGVGAETRLLASVTRTWAWTIWYWVEIEIDGAAVKARLYPEAGPIPDWQVAASTSVTGAGGFGPGGVSLQGMSPTILIKRLEFHPLGAQIPSIPAAAGDADWTLVQVTE